MEQKIRRMYFNSNIKFLRKRKGFTQDNIAKQLGIKRSTLSGYENNIAKPSIKVLIMFSDLFRISIDTLIRINLKEQSSFQLNQLENGHDVFIKGNKLRILATTIDSDNNDNIELVTEKAKAGYTAGFSDPEFINSLNTFNLPFLSKNRKYRTFQISGDSMLPIKDSSWITAEYIEDWSNIKDNTACIILTLNEGIVFKKLKNRLSDGGYFEAHSLNPIYKPYNIHIHDIKEIWNFVHYITKDIPEESMSASEIVKTLSIFREDINSLKERITVKLTN